MKNAFRWYGSKKDPIPLKYIKQIPNIDSIVTQCYEYQPGEKWELANILKLKKEINDAGLAMKVIESVPVHEDIKLGRKTRDQLIENYQETLKNLAQAGVEVVCYNFMPAFDWVRTNLYQEMEDGSFAEVYEQKEIDQLDAFSAIQKFKKLPAWTLSFNDDETEEVIQLYQKMSEEELWQNLEYFINKIIPTCDEYGIKMAIHPDDPSWPIFGIPRLITSEKNLERFLNINPSINHGLTLCVGSLSTNLENDLVKIINKFVERIHFTHLRNIRYYAPGSFTEIAHADLNGVLDLRKIVKAYADHNYQGYMRPDHGRMIWGEEKGPNNPGYGLYDRALGLSYLNGLWEGIKSQAA